MSRSNEADDLQVPAIGYGTGTALRDKDARDYVIQAIEAGFSHIDTAQIYHNEASVGEAIRETGLAREDLFVTTKYSSGPIQQAVRGSLSKSVEVLHLTRTAQLGLRYVDLYLIHWPDFVGGNFEGAWREFEKVKERGSIGVSNFTVEQLQEIVKIAKIKPAVNQIEFHPYTYGSHKPLLAYAAKHDIVIEAYSTLAYVIRHFTSLTAVRVNVDPYADSPITKFPGGPVDTPVDAAARRLGITPTQVILAWAKAKGVVIVTTSSSKQHLREYLAVGDLPPLKDDEIAAIDDAGAKGPPYMYTSTAKCGVLAFAAACAVYTLVLLRMWGNGCVVT
ncbi:hypothetical protein D9615_008620 [Tricholomella constricta]|uniref:NADP-dependent oxidoreductase domain-containing protein n=1 Tax=Tricholomella constricta TaxID=117010 RepID=A0A8H5M0U1_9AGAR|nr:hypothetical protein D9615_008620 [Tricholomella constricta]